MFIFYITKKVSDPTQKYSFSVSHSTDRHDRHTVPTDMMTFVISVASQTLATLSKRSDAQAIAENFEQWRLSGAREGKGIGCDTMIVMLHGIITAVSRVEGMVRFPLAAIYNITTARVIRS
jgi:hypothetical protein